jgi:hypothetical protein
MPFLLVPELWREDLATRSRQTACMAEVLRGSPCLPRSISLQNRVWRESPHVAG